MKRFTQVCAVVLVLLCFIASVRVARNNPVFWCNNQSIGFALRKGGWRAWQISYSFGEQEQLDGTMKNMWHFPHFHHTDIRRIQELRDYTSEETP